MYDIYYIINMMIYFLHSSLELPYVTPLEKQDKQRKTFTKTLANTGIHGFSKPRVLGKRTCPLFHPTFESWNHFNIFFIFLLYPSSQWEDGWWPAISTWKVCIQWLHVGAWS